MTLLRVCTLGSHSVFLGEKPVSGFESTKVRALLVYLMVEADRPHTRETLAGLLWPDYPQSSAMTSLRNALANLRQAISDQTAQPPYLLITRQAIQFNSTSEYWLDLAEFNKGLSPLSGESSKKLDSASIVGLQAAIDLYHGHFLEDFSVPDSGAFEEWALLKREQLNREMMQALRRLADYYEALGDYNQALTFAWKQVELERWQEEGHQQLMRLLALSGRRSEALAQYESCTEMLKKDLGVAPSGVTTALYETIRDEKLTPGIIRLLSELPFPGEPPYKGMQFFDEADAGLFFGRERLILRLVEHLRNILATKERPVARFLAILGASGSGKSSVLRAGLVPAIKTGQILVDGTYPPQGSQNWQVHIITPTPHPLEALACSLASSSNSQIATANLIDDMRCEARSLHLFASKQFPTVKDEGCLLIVVDQFEEIFTLCRAESEREAFIDNLLTAAESPGAVMVIIALRADFYARCSDYQRLRHALAGRQEYIGPMNTEELRQVIERPARNAGWDFETGLVDSILKDTGTEPGALPLLSHALLETWQHRRGRTMTFGGYSETGGVGKAIAQTAESVFNGLTPEQQVIARRIFLRLTESGEGALVTRRRTLLDELISSAGEAGEIEKVFKILADARLITLSKDAAEVAHEALIREWPSLREWLDQDREGLRLRRHLTEAALSWEKLNHDPDELYRGVRLFQAMEWIKQPENAIALSRLEQEFLYLSQEAAEREEAAREEHRQRELETAQALAEEQRQRAEAEAHRAEEQERAARQLRARSLYLVGALCLALVLIVVAVFFAWKEQRQSVIASARELAMAAQGNLVVDPELAILLALQSAAAWTSVGEPIPYDLQNTLHQAIPASRARLTWHVEEQAILSVSFIQPGDQPRVITSDSQAGTVTVWDPQSNQSLATLPGVIRYGSSGAISPIIRLSPDGKHLAVPASNNTVKLWDVSAGRELCSISHPPDEEVLDAYFSPDGMYLLTIDRLNYFVWEAGSCQKQLEILTPAIFSKAAAFSPDGRNIAAVTQEGVVSLVEIVTGRQVSTIQAGFNLTVLAFSPDGSRLFGAGRENYAKEWNIESGETIATLPIYEVSGGQTEAAAYSPDGSGLIIMSSYYQAGSEEPLYTLLGHTKPISSLAFNEAGNQLITSSYDGTVKLWDLSIDHEVFTFSHPSGYLYGVAFSPDGKWLATSGEDKTAVVWELSSGEMLRTLKGHTDIVNNATFSPDGNLLATSGADHIVMVWETLSGQILNTLTGHGQDRTSVPPIRGIFALAFSPLCNDTSGPCPLAGAGLDGQLIIWDALSGIPLITYRDPVAGLMSAAFSPDGTRLAVGNAIPGGGNSWATILDATTGQTLRTLQEAPGWVWGVGFDPDGRRLATLNFLGDGKVWNIEDGQELVDLKGVQNGGYSITYSPDGKLLAAGSNGSVVILDAHTGLPLFSLPGHYSLVVRSSFSPDGRYLATASLDGTVRVYVMPSDDLLILAHSRLTRSLRPEECQKYLHQEMCP